MLHYALPPYYRHAHQPALNDDLLYHNDPFVHLPRAFAGHLTAILAQQNNPAVGYPYRCAIAADVDLGAYLLAHQHLLPRHFPQTASKRLTGHLWWCVLGAWPLPSCLVRANYSYPSHDG